MKQIKKLHKILTEIGFVIEATPDFLQIIDFSDPELGIDKAAQIFQIVIEFEDPTCEVGKFIFQGCSLKVHFEGWHLQDAAKIIKLSIAEILNANDVFRGMEFAMPVSHEEVLVP